MGDNEKKKTTKGSFEKTSSRSSEKKLKNTTQKKLSVVLMGNGEAVREGRGGGSDIRGKGKRSVPQRGGAGASRNTGF